MNVKYLLYLVPIFACAVCSDCSGTFGRQCEINDMKTLAYIPAAKCAQINNLRYDMLKTAQDKIIARYHAGDISLVDANMLFDDLYEADDAIMRITMGEQREISGNPIGVIEGSCLKHIKEIFSMSNGECEKAKTIMGDIANDLTTISDELLLLNYEEFIGKEINGVKIENEYSRFLEYIRKE